MTGEPETIDGSGASSPPAPIEPAKAAEAKFARPAEIITILSVVGIDQLTKLIVRQLVPLHEAINVIPGLLDLTHVQNTGAAFGLLNAADFAYKPAIMIAIAAIAISATAAMAIMMAGLYANSAAFNRPNAAPVFCTCVKSSNPGMTLIASCSGTSCRTISLVS